MALDIKKCFDASLMPAAVLIVVSLVATLLGQFVPALACILGFPILLIQIVVLAWAGYAAVKERRMDLVGGAVTGALAGAIATLVSGIINILLGLIGIGVAVSNVGAVGAGIGGAVLGVAAIIGLVIGMVIGAIMGAILGAIGAFIAGMKK